MTYGVLYSKVPGVNGGQKNANFEFYDGDGYPLDLRFKKPKKVIRNRNIGLFYSNEGESLFPLNPNLSLRMNEEVVANDQLTGELLSKLGYNRKEGDVYEKAEEINFTLARIINMIGKEMVIGKKVNGKGGKLGLNLSKIILDVPLEDLWQPPVRRAMIDLRNKTNEYWAVSE